MLVLRSGSKGLIFNCINGHLPQRQFWATVDDFLNSKIIYVIVVNSCRRRSSLFLPPYAKMSTGVITPRTGGGGEKEERVGNWEDEQRRGLNFVGWSRSCFLAFVNEVRTPSMPSDAKQVK